MAPLFIDGFDYLTIANLGLKWDNTTTLALMAGIYGKGKAIQLTSAGTITKTLSGNVTTGCVAMHIFVNTLAAHQFHIWLDAGTNQVDLRMDATGALFFTRNGTTIGSTTSIRLVPGNTYWIEAEVTINASTGVANLYINDQLALSQSGLNTKTSANSFFNQVQLKGDNNNGINGIDSYHVWDLSGSGINSFPYSEHLIDTKLANAVGSNTTWTKGGSVINANNYQQVNEANEDGDTTYVSSSTPNQIDSYGFTNLDEGSGTIGTVVINTIDRDDDATPRVFDHYVKSSSSTALSSGISPSSTYINHQSFFNVDPNTSAAWTVAGRNNAEFGYKEIS